MTATTARQEWPDIDPMTWGVWDFVALLTAPATRPPAGAARAPRATAPERGEPRQARAV
ncbi:hypothetical protein ACFVWY_26775 [Streptomyces sp. NPDC058195]|uniref:hypothetical protein n=1 Tax=Streptomyces sp. NPDC058195 TaxID=3346375 RepID=UPI0036E6196C